MSMPIISALDFTGDNMVDETIPEDTPMRNFYRNKTIFLTGGTGFLGQIYVEKLLRCRVKRIYLLARPKKDKSSLERIQETFCGVLFKKLKSIDPNYFDRIILIDGDIKEPDLGISCQHRMDIIENVEIMVHAAADVRFQKSVQELCFANVRGTRDIIKLAEEIKHLMVFAYISTAFSHHYRTTIEEKFYSPIVDPDEVIRISEHFSGDTNELIYFTEKLIKPWTNTYVFTKALSEELVRRAVYKIPTVVIRPSIIIGIYDDPVPGWCNNVYGLNGVLFGCGLGLLRTSNFDQTKKSNVVCADFVTNATLSVIWNKANENKTQKLGQNDESNVIYHVTAKDQITYGEMENVLLPLFLKYPSNQSLWFPMMVFTRSAFMFFIMTMTYHVIPGLLFDAFFRLTNNHIRLMPMYRKIQQFVHSLEYFVTHEWHFVDNNMSKVIDKMNKDDKAFFPCDVRSFSFAEYGYTYMLGLRTYIAKEPIDNISLARKRLVKIIIAHHLMKMFKFALLIFIMYFIFKQTGINSCVVKMLNKHFDTNSI